MTDLEWEVWQYGHSIRSVENEIADLERCLEQRRSYLGDLRRGLVRLQSGESQLEKARQQVAEKFGWPGHTS